MVKNEQCNATPAKTSTPEAEKRAEIHGIRWQPFTIPESLQMEAEKAFVLAPKPVVFTSKWEDVKITTTVKKKVGLFGVKTEQVVKTKKKEIKVPIQVASAPIDRGFVEEGALICTLPSIRGLRDRDRTDRDRTDRDGGKKLTGSGDGGRKTTGISGNQQAAADASVGEGEPDENFNRERVSNVRVVRGTEDNRF